MIIIIPILQMRNPQLSEVKNIFPRATELGAAESSRFGPGLYYSPGPFSELEDSEIQNKQRMLLGLDQEE